MSGLDKNRVRNQTVYFRVTAEELQMMESRIKVSGLPKGQYMIESVLRQKIVISVGKYQSDRLSLELRRLRECLEQNLCEGTQTEAVEACKSLLEQLLAITGTTEEEIKLADLRTVKY